MVVIIRYGRARRVPHQVLGAHLQNMLAVFGEVVIR